jgi:hypothetical protein
VTVRIGTYVPVVWLIVGAIAAGQRHDYSDAPTSCNSAATVAVTYVGVDPKISCHVPQPSK